MIDSVNLYQKRFLSADKKGGIIYRLEQIWPDWNIALMRTRIK